MDEGWWNWAIAVAGAAGLAVGAVLTTVVFRTRMNDLLAGAVAHGRSMLQVEVATLSERLQVVQTELVTVRQERMRSQQEAQNLSRSLESMKVDQVRLSERASRVAGLEAEIARLTLQWRMAEEEVRRLAASEAQKAQALASLTEQARRLERDEAHIDQVLAPIRMELSDLRQRLLQVLGARRLAVEEVSDSGSRSRPGQGGKAPR